jgi:hypothetical protein
MPFRDNDWEDLDDTEFPEPEQDDDGPALDRGPHCRQWIYEDSERCPACGQYLEEGTSFWRRPWWIAAVAVLLLIIILLFWI